MLKHHRINLARKKKYSIMGGKRYGIKKKAKQHKEVLKVYGT